MCLILGVCDGWGQWVVKVGERVEKGLKRGFDDTFGKWWQVASRGVVY